MLIYAYTGTQTFIIRYLYADYTLYVRCQYAIHTFVNDCRRLLLFKHSQVVRISSFSKMFIRNTYVCVLSYSVNAASVL